MYNISAKRSKTVSTILVAVVIVVCYPFDSNLASKYSKVIKMLNSVRQVELERVTLKVTTL